MKRAQPKRKAKRGAVTDTVEAPARIGRDHVRTRILSPLAGAAKGWKRQSPLEAAFERGQLAGGNPRFDAAARYEAGRYYETLFAKAQSSGRDSTDMDRIDRSGGGLPLPLAQMDAIRAVAALESRMGARDRRIIRMVCGEGSSASDAVRAICGDYTHTVWARFREALDGLAEARELVRIGLFRN